jgi:hypothetical protein
VKGLPKLVRPAESGINEYGTNSAAPNATQLPTGMDGAAGVFFTGGRAENGNSSRAAVGPAYIYGGFHDSNNQTGNRREVPECGPSDRKHDNTVMSSSPRTDSNVLCGVSPRTLAEVIAMVSQIANSGQQITPGKLMRLLTERNITIKPDREFCYKILEMMRTEYILLKRALPTSP